MTIWNSPADASGTSTVDDGDKKYNKGTFLYSKLKKMYFINAIASECVT